MSRDATLLLNDIQESIGQIERYTQGMDRDAFLEDPMAQDAVIRRFEIIGEAVKGLPDDLKEGYPDIRWRDIAGLRDVLIHGYHRVNLPRLWVVVQEDLPRLKEAISEMTGDR